MTIYKNTFFFILICLSATSCVSYVGTGFYNQHSKKVLKSHDTTTFSGNLQYNLSQKSQSQISGSLSVQRSKKLKHFNFSYGVFTYVGNYYPYNNSDSANRQSYGMGIQTGAGYIISTPDADWKVLGVEAAASHNFSTISSETFSPEKDIISGNTKTTYTLGMSSEVHFRKNNHPWGLKLFVGKPFTNHVHDENRYVAIPVVFNSTAYTQRKHVTAFAQLQFSKKVNITIGFSYTIGKKIKKLGLYKER